MIMNRKKRDQESNNIGLGKTENNKHPGAEGEQHTVKKKLMLHKVRRLQLFERERLPKLKENSKFIKLKEGINGVIEELLEDELDITDINNLIHAAATIQHSFSNLSDERSNASSKMVPPHSAI
jgi:hypothetical protein